MVPDAVHVMVMVVAVVIDVWRLLRSASVDNMGGIVAAVVGIVGAVVGIMGAASRIKFQ